MRGARSTSLAVLLLLLAAGAGAQTFVRWIPPPNVISLYETTTGVVAARPMLLSAGSVTAPSVAFVDDWDGTPVGWFRETSNTWGFTNGTTQVYRITTAYVNIPSQLGMGGTVSVPNILISSPAAYTIGFLNATNPIELYTYNTWGVTNWERAKFKWNANELEIGTEANGTGVVRNVRFTGGTFIFGDSGAKPTCDATTRGAVWYDAGGVGVADTFEVCRKDGADAYAWVSVY